MTEDGQWIVRAAPYEECFAAAPAPRLAIVLSIVYGIGLPTGFAALLVWRRRTLAPAEFVQRFYFFVDRFKDEFYLNEVLIMFRKLGVVVCLTFFGGATEAVQVSLGLEAGREGVGVWDGVVELGSVV